MQVTEERLSLVLARRDHTRGLDRNPVALLVLESMAASRAGHSGPIRKAGLFLLDLIGANEPDATVLTLPVAMQILRSEESIPAEAMRARLLEAGGRDLLLGLSLQALLGEPALRRKQHERRDPVVRTLYLLIRMFEAQEETDALERALRT